MRGPGGRRRRRHGRRRGLGRVRPDPARAVRARPASRSTRRTRCATASRWSSWPTSSASAAAARTASRRSTATSTGTGEVVRDALGPRLLRGSCSASAAAPPPTAARACCRRSAPGCSTPPGTSVRRGGGALADARPVDAVRPAPGAWSATRFVVASDVDNPLLGPRGAAAVFGPQKGATPDDVATLDAVLAHWADVRRRRHRRRMSRNRAGRRRRGRHGYAAMALLGAELRARDRADARSRRVRRRTARGATW